MKSLTQIMIGTLLFSSTLANNTADSQICSSKTQTHLCREKPHNYLSEMYYIMYGRQSKKVLAHYSQNKENQYL